MKVDFRAKFVGVLCCLLLLSMVGMAQRTTTLTRDEGATSTGNAVTYDSQGRPIRNRTNGGKDSLQKRDQYADSITIRFRYFDSTNIRKIDSSINDFTTRFPVQPFTVHLGNFGTAAHSLLFSPRMKSGWDAGFHQYDTYNYTLEQTKFYQTSRPYTELSYLLGNKSEQMINLLHTQNKKNNLNFAFEYRFISAPGAYKNQSNNHNNIRLNFAYTSPNKRYGLQGILISNKNASSENGGVIDVAKLESLSLNDPYELETRLGTAGAAYRSPFNTSISTGNIYKQSTFLLRNYYDFGNKDSVVTDSSVFKLFYTRFRIQHTLTLSKYDYRFIDGSVDSSRYQQYFGLHLLNSTNTSMELTNKFNLLNNELSLFTYPDKHNQNQFLTLGAGVQTIKGLLGTYYLSDYNLYANAAYRNKTKNQVWDLEATGTLYLTGYNAANYDAFISLKKLLSKRQQGSLTLGFQNVNRSPSIIYSPVNNFFVNSSYNFKKENTIRLFAQIDIAKQHLKLSAEYFLVNNYTYFDGFFNAKQYGQLFNMLHVGVEKGFKLSKHLFWYTELHMQQTTGNPPINIPLILTRNRVAFEGNFFTNLFLSTGLEIKYYTNYKAANYSPFTGQFFYQNTYTTSNRPELNAFLHFRIKSFKAFVRLENLNTLFPGSNQYLVHTQNYAGTGMWFRLGVWWNFVN